LCCQEWHTTAIKQRKMTDGRFKVKYVSSVFGSWS